LLLSYTSSQNGKNKEVVPPKNVEGALEVNRGQQCGHKKRKESNSSSLPLPSAIQKLDVPDPTAVQVSIFIVMFTLAQTKMSKQLKVTQGSVLPTHNMLKEDVHMVSYSAHDSTCANM
jgi:hypothetical protein